MGSDDYKLMIKGKRSKRQRFASTMAAPSSSSSSSDDISKSPSGLILSNSTMSASPHESNISPTNSVELELINTTQVEQDMANCLILLAQGQRLPHQNPQAITFTGGQGLYNVYRCKTCERAFPSFQALGGHRASHKRPNPAPTSKAVQKVMVDDQDHKFSEFSCNTSTTLSLQSSRGNKKSSSSRVHGCSICGSEFASGQALGGHMRSHRSTLVLPPPPMMMATTNHHDDETYCNKQPTNILSLDLNLLPPLEGPKFLHVGSLP